VEIARYPVTAKIAKSVLPRTGRLLAGSRCQGALAFAETAFAILQGKGSGGGWGIDSEVAAALPFIAPDGVVLDVGANYGEWAERVLAARGDVKLYLFEPQQACQALMSEAVRKKTTLVQAAVGETEGQMILYCTPGEPNGLASLHVRKDFPDVQFDPMNVQVITLDGFIAQHGIKSVDFMKMDIEGHELFALRGAAAALRSGVIKALSFEFGLNNVNSRTFFQDYWELLTSAGYELHRILPSGRTASVRRYEATAEHFRGVSNYLATLRTR
jgi:FkbM family methyltransferase